MRWTDLNVNWPATAAFASAIAALSARVAASDTRIRLSGQTSARADRERTIAAAKSHVDGADGRRRDYEDAWMISHAATGLSAPLLCAGNVQLTELVLAS